MALLTGTVGPDNLQGTSGDDDLRGLDGNDNLTDYLGGDDVLSGGSGNDFLLISRGQGASRVMLDGGDGNDSLSVSGGPADGGAQINFTMTGGAGNDSLSIFGGNITGLIDAGAGDDVVNATVMHGPITVRLGAGGADRIFLPIYATQSDVRGSLIVEDFQPGDAGDAFELILNIFAFTNFDFSNPFGSGGFLRLVQNGADAVLQIDSDGGGDGFRELARFVGLQTSQFTAKNFGGFPPTGEPPAGRLITGSTVFLNGSGNENLTGGIGPDTINGQVLGDRIEAGPGNDVIDGGTGDDQIFTDYGDDTANGGEGADTLQGGQRDLLRGGAGNDVLTGASYFDPVARFTLEGGAGDDRLTLNPIKAAHTGLAFGGEGADTLQAGGEGSATLDGGSGDDIVLAQPYAGPVTVSLGGGQDAVYVASGGPPSRTVITDFAAGDGGDRIRLLDFLRGANPNWNADSNPFAAGLVRLAESGGSTVVQLLFEGQWRDSLVLQGVSPSLLRGANFEGYSPDGGPPTGMVLQGQSGADSLLGGVGGDALTGGDGADTLAGGLGSDTIDGGAGADSIVASAGSDILRGGAGNDVVSNTVQFPLPGANGHPGSGGAGTQAFGGEGDDLINLDYRVGGGEMLVDGGEGNDQLTVGAGTAGFVRMLGGAGHDNITLYGFTSPGLVQGTIDGGDGNDGVTIRGRTAVTITLGAGADVITLGTYPGDSSDSRVVDFSLTDDRISLQTTAVRLGQQAGDTVVQVYDFATDVWSNMLRLTGIEAAALKPTNVGGFSFGSIPPVWLVGGGDADVLTAGAFGRVDGGDGDDMVTGGAADELLRGASGHDTLVGGGGLDTLNGGVGDDNAAAGDGNDSITDAAGANYLRGDAGDDHIVGGFGFDDINGNMGDDLAFGGLGDDWVVGGKDNDLLFGDAGGDLVYGNLGADTCDGGDGNDIVRGGQDNDWVRGGAGDDFVSGDRGDDTMTGGAGADVFHSFAETGLDRVIDFNYGQGDRLRLDPGTKWTVEAVGFDTVVTMEGGGRVVLLNLAFTELPRDWIGVG